MSNKENKNRTESTEVAVVGSYAVLEGMDVLQEAMAEECEGLEFGFDRIKIPSGGSTAFEVPSDDDVEDTTLVKEVSGVILHQHAAFAYYEEKYTGGNNPPDCGSFDGVIGIGNPGGNCKECPLNVYGSGEGQGKACRNKRHIYILRQGELFPLVLSLPTGSLQEFTKYVKRNLTKGRKLSHVVTKVSLKKATNNNGIVYSQAVFAFERVLEEAEKVSIAQMVTQVKEYAKNLTTSALIADEAAEMVAYTDEGEEIQPLN